MKIHRVEAPHCRGGEQPLWDVDQQALYYIDNSGRKIHRYLPAAGASKSWDMPDVITSLALRQGGGAVITLRAGIQLFDFDSGRLEMLHPLADPPPLVYNDAKVDRQGRWIIGASTANFTNPGPEGGLFRLDPDRSLVQLDSGIHFSNGPCFSPDSKTLYFSDSWLKNCYAYDYDIETGSVTNRRVFAGEEALQGLPDGATVDRDGLVWIALYGAAKIAAFRPDGRLEHAVDMPVKLVSSVMFGGPDLDQLFVTTIEREHGSGDGPVEAGAGDLYVIEGLGAQGLPEPRFAG